MVKGVRHSVVLEVTFNRTCATAVGRVAVSVRCVTKNLPNKGSGDDAHNSPENEACLYHMRRFQVPDQCRMKPCCCAPSQEQLPSMTAHSVRAGRG